MLRQNRTWIKNEIVARLTNDLKGILWSYQFNDDGLLIEVQYSNDKIVCLISNKNYLDRIYPSSDCLFKEIKRLLFISIVDHYDKSAEWMVKYGDDFICEYYQNVKTHPDDCELVKLLKRVPFVKLVEV